MTSAEIATMSLPNRRSNGDTSFITMEALTEWFMAAEPGEWMVYATGDLAHDLCKYKGSPTNIALIQVAGMARELSERNQAHLTQRRVSRDIHSLYEYRITKR